MEQLHRHHGKNFIGTKNLNDLMAGENVNAWLSKRKIEFNPEFSPHRGGSWERHVQSNKNVLHSMNKEVVNVEDFRTLQGHQSQMAKKQ